MPCALAGKTLKALRLLISMVLDVGMKHPLSSHNWETSVTAWLGDSANYATVSRRTPRRPAPELDHLVL